jgi:hypothetical protein
MNTTIKAQSRCRVVQKFGRASARGSGSNDPCPDDGFKSLGHPDGSFRYDIALRASDKCSVPPSRSWADGCGQGGGGSRVGGLADALLGSFLRRRLPRPVNKADFNYTLCIYRLGVLFIFNVERDRRPGDCSNPFIPGFLIDIHAPFRLSEINRLCSSVAALYNLTAMKPSAPVSFSIVIKSLQGIFFFYRPVVEPRIN